MPGVSEKLFIYQINTWVWLNALSREHGMNITLANVPESALRELARPGIDMIWLMGVWQRSPFGRQIGLKYKYQYQSVLPDIKDDDVIGSAYAIHDYRVDDGIGGRKGLAKFRLRLAALGIKLMLDFVPNHVAADHAWTARRPEYIVQGQPIDLERRRSDFFPVKTSTGQRVLAHGRDPNFAGWSDTAQLNAFNPDLRKAHIDILLDIAAQCDGVRCDMAMLMFNDIFANTWNGYVGEKPATDYWRDVIPAIRARYPVFTFVAEVYWDKEYEIIQQGFDFAYDKTFYDRVGEGDVIQLRAHLLANIDYQQHLLRFIENHDEKRAYETLGAQRSRPAATLICTLPGGALLHEGQLVGRTKKLPVQIKRQPDEPADRDLEAYYLRLLRETADPIYRDGQFYLFNVNPAGAGDYSNNNLLAYGWNFPGKDYRLIVVNLTGYRSLGRVKLEVWDWLKDRTWCLFDSIDDTEYERHGREMTHDGLFVDLAPYESHIFKFALDPETITEIMQEVAM